MTYEDFALSLRAIADPNRLKIIDLLSCGSLCACDLLKHFDFSQPTLSHHMKVLQAVGLVEARKEGRWQHYSLNRRQIDIIEAQVGGLFHNSSSCICHEKKDKGEITIEKDRVI